MTRVRTRAILSIGTASVVLLGVLAAPGAAGAAPEATSIPTVRARLGSSVTLSRTHLHPGRVTFDVRSPKGDHTLQIARLHGSYTLAQANKDINAGFEGNAAAIRRADHNVTFKGGAPARPGAPGRFTIYLAAGRYLAVNFDNGKARAFTVSGSPINTKTVATTSSITMLTYGFDTKSALPHSGVMSLGNVSDQPHFLVMQHVKAGTTRAMVAKAFSMDTESQPTFLLKAGIDTGVLSATKSQAFSYDLPAGRYVIACFWPDDETGMEHAAMGMFKLITLT